MKNPNNKYLLYNLLKILYFLCQHNNIIKKNCKNYIETLIMNIYIDDYKNLVIITPAKTIRANLSIKINESLKYDVKFIVSRNESLIQNKIKNNICGLSYGREYGH